MQIILAWLGQLGLTATVGAVAAYGLFKWLGQKWVEARLANELEAFKAEKQEQRDAVNRDFQRESDRLKAEVARLADRASHLHRREFEVLPQAWVMLNKAYGRVMEAMRSGAIYPHFDQTSRAALEHFIDNEDLDDHQKAELRAAPNWYPEYTRMRENRAVLQARVLVADFNNFVVLNGVFFDEPLADKMTVAKDLVSSANEKRWAILEGINEPSDEETAKADLAKAASLIIAIKSDIRDTMRDTSLQAPT